MEVICGLFVSHYRAADLQIRAGSNAQDTVQRGHWRKHGRSYCAEGWKEVRRKLCWKRHVWITCVLRMQLNLKRQEEMNVQNMRDYLSSPILTTWGSCGRPDNSWCWTVSSATKKAAASSSKLLIVPAPSAGITFEGAILRHYKVLSSCTTTQALLLWSWSCTPHRPPIFPSLCSHVRGCPIELSK